MWVDGYAIAITRCGPGQFVPGMIRPSHDRATGHAPRGRRQKGCARSGDRGDLSPGSGLVRLVPSAATFDEPEGERRGDLNSAPAARTQSVLGVGGWPGSRTTCKKELSILRITSAN